MTEQTKFAYSPVGKVYKQIKTIKHKGVKQTKAIEDHRKQPTQFNVLDIKDDFGTYDTEKDNELCKKN